MQKMLLLSQTYMAMDGRV